MSKSQADYVRDGGHLPSIMRDFHDQKEIFKSAWEWFTDSGKDPPPMGISWMAGHVFTVDCFLKFMAAHGWTMQRSRADVEFADIQETIKDRRDREAALLRSVLTAPSRANEGE